MLCDLKPNFNRLELMPYCRRMLSKDVAAHYDM